MRRIDAAAAIDGAGFALGHPSGVSAVIERAASGELTLAALGPTDQIAASTRWAGAPVIDRRGCLLIPGLVNAHTHLDLTHIGPRPHDPAAGFAVWIDMIRRERLTDQVKIAESVQRGVELSLAGGTVLVGDIAGAVGGRASQAAGRALAIDGRVNGVSYVEFFAQGMKGPDLAVFAYDAWRGLSHERFLPQGRVVFGLQPHAPYSVGLRYYEDILESVDPQTPTCTHLAESPAERAFVASASGPIREMLEKIGVWDALVAGEVGRGRSPIDHLETYLASGNLTAVHCNDVSNADLDTLTQTATRAVYCPRASAYFAAERDFGPHRYREMLARGLTVALGTDSIVNLGAPDRISTWDEMRFLHQRDGTDPFVLLRMATTNGAEALRRDSAPFQFIPLGTLAGLVAIPVPAPNLNAHPSELLREALSDGRNEEEGGHRSEPLPELIAIGRV